MVEPLPQFDSHDPYEVLGLDRSAAKIDVRRAYIRLIKIYRPERDPQSFQLIHEAYESIRDRAPRRREPLDDDEEEDWDLDGPGSNQSSDESVTANSGRVQAAAVWHDVAMGREPTEAELQMQALVQAHPADSDLQLQQFLLRDALVPETDIKGLLDSVASGSPLVRAVVLLGEDDDFEKYFEHNALRWNLLRATPDLEAALWLISRCVRLWADSGRLERACAEVLSEDFVRDALDHDVLEEAARYVGSITVWFNRELAHRIWTAYPSTDPTHAHGWTVEDHYEAGTRLHDAWMKWFRAHADFPLLRKFVPTASVAPDERVAELASKIQIDFFGRTDRYRHALTEMSDASPDLVDFYAQSIQLQPHKREHDPSDSRVAQMARMLASAERRMERSLLYQGVNLSAVGLVGVGLFSIKWIGWWSILTILASIGFAMSIFEWSERRAYMRRVRAPLSRLVAELRVSPLHIAAHLRAHAGSYSNLIDVVDRIETDPVLDALYWTSRLDEPAKAVRALDEDE